MNTKTATQVLAESTTAFEAQGYTREVAFNAAIATMISEDADTMRKFLTAAQAQYQQEVAA